MTGVGIRSLHNSFGEKEEIFLRTLQSYHAMVRGVLDQMLADRDMASVARIFQMTVQDPGDALAPQNTGCPMINTVFEVGNLPRAIADQINA